jgi:hypothetical protein
VTKISQLSSIGDSLAIGDQFLIRDIDDAGSPNKSVTVSGITRALADGNATAPALAFAADKNTGIYRAGTDSLAVATNGTGRLFVDASGNVGLGVLNPTSTANGLDISSGGLSLVVGANNTQTTRTNATTKTSRIASFHYTNTEEPVAIAVADSTATSNVIYFGGSTSLCNAATELIFYTAANNTTATGSERLRITSAGLVGIGTSSPDERLHVKATGTQRVDLAKFELAGQRSLLVQGQWGAMDIGTSNGILQYTSGNLGFRTSASGNANMLLDISGRVGIGTTSPATTLDVNGTIACSSTAGGIAFTANSSAVAFSAGLYRPATDNLAFVTGGSEKARLDGSGRLLVGTSTARSVGAITARLQVEGSTTADASVNIINTINFTDPPTLRFGKVRGTGTVLDGDLLGQIAFCGHDGTDLNTPGAYIYAVVDGTPGANDLPSRLVFSTTADGAASPTERMRITSGGDALFGVTSAGVLVDASSPAGGGYVGAAKTDDCPVLLKRSGTDGSIILFAKGGVGNVGGITVTTTSTAYVTSSDYRLKENVTPVTDGIKSIGKDRRTTHLESRFDSGTTPSFLVFDASLASSFKDHAVEFLRDIVFP